MIQWIIQPDFISSIGRPIVFEIDTDVTGKPEIRIRCELYGIKGNPLTGTPELLGTKTVRPLPDNAQKFRFNFMDLIGSALSEDIAETTLPQIIIPNDKSIINYYGIFTEMYYDGNGLVQDYDNVRLPATSGFYTPLLYGCNTLIQHTDQPQTLDELIAFDPLEPKPFLTISPRRKLLREGENEQLHFFVAYPDIGLTDPIELSIERTDANNDPVPYIVQSVHIEFDSIPELIALVALGWQFSSGTLDLTTGNLAPPSWLFFVTGSFIASPDPDVVPQNAFTAPQSVSYAVALKFGVTGIVGLFGRTTAGAWTLIASDTVTSTSFTTYTYTGAAVQSYNQIGLLFLFNDGTTNMLFDDLIVIDEARFFAMPVNPRAIASLPNLLEAPAVKAEVKILDFNGDPITETFTYIKDERCLTNAFRFAFKNHKGGIDHYTFIGSMTKRKKVKKSGYRKQLDYDISPSHFGVTWNTEDRGQTTLEVESDYIYTIWSDYEDHETREWIAGMYDSQLVEWVFPDGRRVAIEPRSKSTDIHDDDPEVIVQFKFEFQEANKTINHYG